MSTHHRRVALTVHFQRAGTLERPARRPLVECSRNVRSFPNPKVRDGPVRRVPNTMACKNTASRPTERLQDALGRTGSPTGHSILSACSVVDLGLYGPSCQLRPLHLSALTCTRRRAGPRTPAVPSPEVEWQEPKRIPRGTEESQNMRSAGLSVPKDPTFAIARLIRIWLSLRALPIESLRSSTLNPQQSVLYVICEIEYRKIDCR